MSARDEAEVKAFMDAWRLEAPGMRDDLLAMLRRAREDAAGQDPYGAVMTRAEARIREVLARLGPPGTEVTPALLSKVQREITAIVKDELVTSGMGENMAMGLAAILATAMRVRQRY